MPNSFYGEGTYTLDYKFGDVNGDKLLDKVYLTGEKAFPKENFSENITLAIKYGLSKKIQKVPLKNAAGYNSEIFLGNFTSNQKKDILISIDSGGSGGYILAYLYAINNDTPVLLLDADSFNENSSYSAVFINNFKVLVSSSNKKIQFTIDLESKKNMYIEAGVYNADGKLLKETYGEVLGLGALLPLVSNYNGLYELIAYQRIIGIYNADNLGTLITYLKWNGNTITADRVQLSILPNET